MTPSREEALFALALEKPADKRAAFLDVMCEGDPALRRSLDALLAAPLIKCGHPGSDQLTEFTFRMALLFNRPNPPRGSRCWAGRGSS